MFLHGSQDHQKTEHFEFVVVVRGSTQIVIVDNVCSELDEGRKGLAVTVGNLDHTKNCLPEYSAFVRSTGFEVTYWKIGGIGYIGNHKLAVAQQMV